jgi:hypothetical protein
MLRVESRWTMFAEKRIRCALHEDTGSVMEECMKHCDMKKLSSLYVFFFLLTWVLRKVRKQTHMLLTPTDNAIQRS